MKHIHRSPTLTKFNFLCELLQQLDVLCNLVQILVHHHVKNMQCIDLYPNTSKINFSLILISLKRTLLMLKY